MPSSYNQNIELLNLVIAGSVDDGKSTLIGRLFYDTDRIYNDQLESLVKASGGDRSQIDLSLFTDGLSAEREQKITIDVAYRYFATAKRRFIIADVPGHEQYTKNMVTGASNANLAIILADARKGLLEQSKRHLSIAATLGIPHIVVLINKMDLVDYQEEVYQKIKQEFIDFAIKLSINDLQFIPISAAVGDMVVGRGENLTWYQGDTVLSYLENLEITTDRNLIDFRFPVQAVIRPHQDLRAYLGQVVSGEIKTGEEVMILPSGKKTRVKQIIADFETKDYAYNPQSVAIVLEDECDISRGDMIVRVKNIPQVGRNFEAAVCWMASEPLLPKKSYLLKQTTKKTRCFIEKIYYELDINTLHRKESTALELNQIGKVLIKTNEPLVFDNYSNNKNTGSFIIIDQESNNTVAAGLILNQVKNEAAQSLSGKKMAPVLWFTGLSGSGKSTIADKLALELKNQGVACQRLDGDIMREMFGNDLGFSPEDRDKNIARAAAIAEMLSRNGITVIATFISPYKRHRDLVRNKCENFVEIYVSTPLEVCEQRDVKGLYQKARKGEIPNFTGISDEYEVPENPDLLINASINQVADSSSKIIKYLYG